MKVAAGRFRRTQGRAPASWTWTPSTSSPAGLRLWLKADQGVYQNNSYDGGTLGGGIFTTLATVDADLVRGWKDYSGSSLPDGSVYFSSGDTALKLNIKNGLPVVRFSGNNNGLLENLTFPPSVNRTIFAVAASRNVSAWNPLIVQNANGGCSFGWVGPTNPTRLQLVQGGVALQALSVAEIASNQFVLFGSKWNSSGNVLYRNGTQENTNSNVLSGTAATLFLAANSATQCGAVDLGELLIYNVALSDADRIQVENYLLARWGLLRDGPPPTPSTNLLAVCDGNSITLGLPGTVGNSYPSQMATALGASWQVVNDGVGSQTTPGMISTAPFRVDNLYNVLRTKNIVVVWEGTNHITGDVGAATAYASLKSYCEARRAYGWKVIILTVLPRSDSYALAVSSPGFESIRQTVNASIVANWATFADGLVDIGANATIGQAGQETNATYYVGDNCHLKTAGLGIVAAAVKDDVLLI